MSGTPETYMPANESNDDDRAPLMSPQSIKTQPVTVPANPTKTPTTLDEIQRLKKEYDDLQAELIRTTNTEYESRLNASEAQLKKFIRDLDKRQNFLKREIPWYIAIAIATGILAAITAFLAPIVLPWIIIAGLAAASVNYSIHSRNWRITAGRGIAIIISLATASVGLVSGIAFFPSVPWALAFAGGCLLANIILYRTSVPKVLAKLFSFEAKDTAAEPTNNGLPFHRKWLKKLSDKLSQFRESMTTEKLKQLVTLQNGWRAITIPAAIVTGIVLTVTMAASWGSSVATLLGTIAPALVPILGAPYVFIPLMIIVGIANCAFVYRGLTRLFDAFKALNNAYKLGIYEDPKMPGSYKAITGLENPPVKAEPKYTGGQTAVLKYCFNIEPTDSRIKTIRQVVVRSLLILSVITFIAIISQMGLVNSNVTHASFLPIWLATFVTFGGVATIVAYISRMAFVMLDLSKVADKVVNFVTNFIRALFTKAAWIKLARTIIILFSFRWFKPAIKESHKEFMQLVKSQTQDYENIPYWQAAFGNQWKKYWDQQCDEDWRNAKKTRLYHKISWWFARAIVISVLRKLIWIAIVANSFSNAAIAAWGGPDQNAPLTSERIATGLNSSPLNGQNTAAMWAALDNGLSSLGVNGSGALENESDRVKMFNSIPKAPDPKSAPTSIESDSQNKSPGTPLTVRVPSAASVSDPQSSVGRSSMVGRSSIFTSPQAAAGRGKVDPNTPGGRKPTRLHQSNSQGNFSKFRPRVNTTSSSEIEGLISGKANNSIFAQLPVAQKVEGPTGTTKTPRYSRKS